jgi:HEAT repeat protein
MYRTICAALFALCLILTAQVGSAQDKDKQKDKEKVGKEAEIKKKAEDIAARKAAQEKDRQAAAAAEREKRIAVIQMEAAAAMSAASGTSGAAAPPAVPEVGRDESQLRSVGVSTDGPGLLAFFRLRSPAGAKPERLATLTQQLGDNSASIAQKASGELAAIGAPAIPLLRRAVKDSDHHQMVKRATRLLQALEEHPGELSSAAARLMGQRRPRGAAEALLAFLPYAEDEGVIEEIRLALIAGGYHDGQPDPALLRALRDDSPIRRGLAIDTLCQNGITPSVLEQVPLRQLLHDPKPSVRLRAALALARARDARAVTALITLLTELPLEQARQAEDFLSELAGDQAPKTALGTNVISRQKCRDDWEKWWQGSEDGEQLLGELRKRTLTEDVRRKCEILIAQLGDTDFAVREKAEAGVRAMGALIVPLLRQAVMNGDLEIRRRARACLADMERDRSLPLPPLVPRLIALRKPAGAAEALLAYCPYAGDDTIMGEVQVALNAVAFKDGKLDPAVIRGLTESLGPRRAAAAEALCLSGDREHLSAVRRLLHDGDPVVRLKTALALAGIHEREAVPVLIDLIGELPSAQSAPAEEYLQRVALDRGPANLPSGEGSRGENRKKRHEAWVAWWKANGDRVVLVDRYPPANFERFHGYTLLVLANSGQVMELGVDRKIRWQINGLLNPRDVQVIGPDRILVAEYNGQRVTERNRRGEIIWQKQLPNTWPLAVQRLRNGHIFITCQNKLVEVDRGGHEVLSIDRPQNDVVMARRMRDGQIILVSTNRVCSRMDATGKELKSFTLQMVWQHNGVDILPNGNVLVPAQWMNRVTEYDTEGKTVFDATVMQPTAACRMPNGNVLVAPQQWPSKVVELDPTGKQVSEYTTANYVFRIRQR